MARRPVLQIDGVTYKNVYQVSWELYTSKDNTGRPADRAHAGVIKVWRESDENVDVARWAMDSSQPKWKAGKILFKSPNDATMKELAWEEGFVTRYEEIIPHIKDRPDDQVSEYFEISAHKVKIGDAEIDNRWEE
ncbi:MAG: type VI secretion system tube protein TssD [Candidatus Zixiibacteriota bacterium]